MKIKRRKKKKEREGDKNLSQEGVYNKDTIEKGEKVP